MIDPRQHHATIPVIAKMVFSLKRNKVIFTTICERNGKAIGPDGVHSEVLCFLTKVDGAGLQISTQCLTVYTKMAKFLPIG